MSPIVLIPPRCDLEPVTWEQHPSKTSAKVFHRLRTSAANPPIKGGPRSRETASVIPNGLLFLFLRAERGSYSVNRGNLRAVINGADPAQRGCIPAKAIIQQQTQADRQARAAAIHSHGSVCLERNPHHPDQRGCDHSSKH